MDLTDYPRLGDRTNAKLYDLQSQALMGYLSCLSETRSATKALEWYLTEHGDTFGARYIKEEQKRRNDGGVPELITRAAAAPATTTNSSWAQPLVGLENLVFGFLQIAHATSLLGRLPGVHRIPFGAKIPYENQAANYGWVKETGSVPVSQMVFAAAVELAPRKACAIVTFSKELLRAMPPGTEEALRDTLVGGLVSFQDAALLSTAAAVPDTSPAGILSGIVATPPGATFADSVAALLDAFFAGRPGAQTVSIIAAPRQAAKLRVLNGGAGTGLPIVETDAAGSKIIVIDGNALFFGDGGIEITLSQQAAIQLNSTPDDPATASTVVTSLWQANLTGFKPLRTINWWLAPNGAQFLA